MSQVQLHAITLENVNKLQLITILITQTLELMQHNTNKDRYKNPLAAHLPFSIIIIKLILIKCASEN